MAILQCGLLSLAVAFPSVLAAAQSGPEALQSQGIAKLDHVRDQFRRSGMQPSVLNDLDAAATNLADSYRSFVATSNFAQATLSLIKLADRERQAALLSRLTPATQAQSGGRRADILAGSARDHYKAAAVLARQDGGWRLSGKSSDRVGPGRGDRIPRLWVCEFTGNRSDAGSFFLCRRSGL